MHVFDPYGIIQQNRRRHRRRELIKLALVWAIALCALGVTLGLSLAQR